MEGKSMAMYMHVRHGNGSMSRMILQGIRSQ
jgi:hypothetical protein